MTEDNSSWFGNLLVSSVFFFSANDACLSRGNDSSNQKRLLPVRTSRTLIACFCFCVSMQLHISNTEHVLCACNDYKLQELTFKCLNLYFVRVIRTLKGGIERLQILFKWFNLDSYYPLPD